MRYRSDEPLTIEVPEILQSLASREGRREAVRELARHTGADEVLIFTKDPEIQSLLPIPGLPQTLPRGLDWREFLDRCLDQGDAVGSLPFPGSAVERAVRGLRISNESVIVAAGDRPDVERLRDVARLLALQIFGFNREREAHLKTVQARMAEETALRAQALAESVDDLRRRLDRQLELTKAITDSLGEGVFSLDDGGRVTFVNPVAGELLGWPESELVGALAARTIFPEPEPGMSSGVFERISEAFTARRPVPCAGTQFRKRDGGTFPVRCTAAPIRTAEGVRGVVVVFNDLTEQLRIEQQMRETQKLESIGLLAGGIAHDFNNLLTGILGNASLALSELHPSHSAAELIEAVVTSGERAAGLTRQLLAYAGKGRFMIGAVDLTELARETQSLVRASIPRSVEVRLQLTEALPAVEADRMQLQQLLMNLIINGAEAIPENRTGTVTVSTSVQHIDAHYIARMECATQIEPGNYVCLEIADTGIGMDRQTVARIFDPFFTTKFTGRGLGLAAAAGIVRSHKGAIEVFSELGKGARFRVLLPGSSKSSTVSEPDGRASDQGLVLLVDDEELVRQTAASMLGRFHYRFETATHGSEAVAKVREDPKRFGLVLLDLAMPGMSGEETFRQIHAIRPDLPVIIASGYSENEAKERLKDESAAAFLSKPFTATQLLELVRRHHRTSALPEV